MKHKTHFSTLLLAVLLSMYMVMNPSFAPPSTRLVVTVQTDKAPGQVWHDLFVEGANITTPGFAALRQPVLSITSVTVNDVAMQFGVDWNVTQGRLYIIHDAATSDVISVVYLGAYALRETVEISGTVKYDGALVESGLVGIEVENTGANFTLRTIPTGTAPNPGSQVEVISFLLTDSLNNTKNTFERGEKLYFSITVKNIGEVERDVLVACNLYDSDNAVLGFEYVRINPLRANTTFGPWISQGVTIPKWASVGNTQAYAGIHSGWPKENGFPYAPDTAANLTIVESIYENLPTNPIPQQPVENGTYTMKLRLPPDPSNGTYRASVCATYEGWHSEWSTTTFQVVDIAAPPIASFIAQPPVQAPNVTMAFDASYSSAEGFNDSITGYWWSFGDGNNATGMTTSHNYPQKGYYTVTLNVTDLEGYWNTTSRTVRVADIRDVALTSIQCVNKIYTNWLFTLKIKIRNQGAFTENCSITAYYNGSAIGTTAVSNLLPQTERTMNIQWNTAGLPVYVSYIVTAEAVLPADIDPSDNSITYGTTRTKALGDIDGDRDIDIFDIVQVAALYGIDSNNLRWNVQMDLAPNGKIDIFDIVTIAGNYGKKY